MYYKITDFEGCNSNQCLCELKANAYIAFLVAMFEDLIHLALC